MKKMKWRDIGIYELLLAGFLAFVIVTSPKSGLDSWNISIVAVIGLCAVALPIIKLFDGSSSVDNKKKRIKRQLDQKAKSQDARDKSDRDAPTANPVKLAVPANQITRKASVKDMEQVEQALNAGAREISQDSEKLWRVLDYDVENKQALITTGCIVTTRAYLSASVPSSRFYQWEYSGIRGWLNKDYFESLPVSIKSKVHEVKNLNPKNPEHRMGFEEHPTNDRVFLLSIDEAKRYFQDDAARTVRHQGDTCPWWLRSVGKDSVYAAYVTQDGAIDTEGFSKKAMGWGVRPAFWLDLKAVDLEKFANERRQEINASSVVAKTASLEHWAALRFICPQCGFANKPTDSDEHPCLCKQCGVETHDFEHKIEAYERREETSTYKWDECKRCGFETNHSSYHSY
jgi:hypothetical protein